MSTKSDGELQQEIVSSMQSLMLENVQGLNKAARDLQAAAPSVALGWDPTNNGGAALAAMREAWTRARSYWERAEGTLAPLFPDLDGSMDSRYEDLLDPFGSAGDPSPYDGDGVTGMHAVERILYAPGPASVMAYELSLPGYRAAAWPMSDQEAADFKSGLCQRLVDDSQLLLDQWKTRQIDLGIVFNGLTGLISAQAEKVSLAANSQQESRYSRTTMTDLRSNLAGTRAIYDLFRPWLATKPYSATLNSNALHAFERLDMSYSAVVGEDIPMPPPTWGPSPHSPSDLATPFGVLYVAVVQEADPTRAGSAVDSMNAVAKALALPEFTGQN